MQALFFFFFGADSGHFGADFTVMHADLQLVPHSGIRNTDERPSRLCDIAETVYKARARGEGMQRCKRQFIMLFPPRKGLVHQADHPL